MEDEEEARKKAYALKYKDDSTLAARARLHHVITNAPKSALDKESEDRLRQSCEKATHNMGTARMDDPDTLRTILKYYSHDVEKKREALLEFFDQYTIDELNILEAVVLRGSPSPIDIDDDILRDHSFVRKATEWRGIAQSHGSLFLRLIQEAKDRKEKGGPPPTARDLLSMAFYQMELQRKEEERHQKEEKVTAD